MNRTLGLGFLLFSDYVVKTVNEGSSKHIRPNTDPKTVYPDWKSS